LDAVEVHNRIRGMSPIPGAWTMHDDVQLKVLRSRLGGHGVVDAAGTVVSVDKTLEIACGQGSIHAEVVQREGRAKLSAEDFVNGYRIFKGDTLQ
jgi:methionyl-tRNA formyltransferase